MTDRQTDTHTDILTSMAIAAKKEFFSVKSCNAGEDDCVETTLDPMPWYCDDDNYYYYDECQHKQETESYYYDEG